MVISSLPVAYATMLAVKMLQGPWEGYYFWYGSTNATRHMTREILIREILSMSTNYQRIAMEVPSVPSVLLTMQSLDTSRKSQEYLSQRWGGTILSDGWTSYVCRRDTVGVSRACWHLMRKYRRNWRLSWAFLLSRYCEVLRGLSVDIKVVPLYLESELIIHAIELS